MKLYSSFLLLTTLGGSNAIDIGALVGGGGGGLGDATMGLDPIILMKLMGSLSSCDIDVLGTGMADRSSSFEKNKRKRDQGRSHAGRGFGRGFGRLGKRCNIPGHNWNDCSLNSGSRNY